MTKNEKILIKLDFVHAYSESLEIFALDAVDLNGKGVFNPFPFK